MSMLSDQNVSILIVSNMYYGNIGILWNKKFCMKSWYNSKLLWLLAIFFVCFLGIKYLDISNSHTTYISATLLMLPNVSTPWILSVNFTVSDFLKCYLLFCVKLAVIYIPSLKSILLENFTNRLLSIRLFRAENLTSQ